MINKNIITVNVDKKEVIIDKNEAAVRLKIPRSYSNEVIEKCKSALFDVITPKYAFIKVPVVLKADNIYNIGFDIKSFDLCKALKGSTEAYILGATIGIGVDRLISRLAITSPAESFITDALASATVEALCDYADNNLRGNGIKPFRFSAGYGDMSLEYQKEILSLLNADNTLGITLNSSLLMTPMKSITAIMGVKP